MWARCIGAQGHWLDSVGPAERSTTMVWRLIEPFVRRNAPEEHHPNITPPSGEAERFLEVDDFQAFAGFGQFVDDVVADAGVGDV